MKRICCIAIALLLLAFPGIAQFQRQFGTALDESFTKVFKSGSNYYVLGTGEAVEGQTRQATISRLNALGELQWTRSLTTGSRWNDGVLTPDGNLLVVGQSMPDDNTSRGIMALITSAGTFTWVRSYDIPNRDAFTKIVRNPAPQNANFPYYVLGHQLQSLPSTDDVFLMNINETGDINWKKIFLSMADDEFANDLEALPNGDMLLAGHQEGYGVIFKIDKNGNGLNAVTPANPFNFIDITPASGGGFIALGYSFQEEKVHLIKFDPDLINQWDVVINGMTEAYNVWQVPASGNIYITGLKLKPCMYRFSTGMDSPTLEWAKYLDNGVTQYEGGYSTFLSPNQIAYVDGRTIASGGFGERCAFLSVSDLELNTCMTQETNDAIQPSDQIFNGPLIPNTEFYDAPMAANQPSAARTWQQANACGTPCEASFTVNNVDNCGHVQVTGTSTGLQPISYQWCTGETTPNLDVMLPCGPHTFCVSVTCADGSMSSATQTINVVDNTPPAAVCAPGFGVILGADCSFSLNTEMIDGGSTDNCMIQSMEITPSTLNGCGLFPVTLKVTDWCGNMSTCTTSIQTTEDVPPIIMCPPNVQKTCNTDLTPNFTGSATATDNCNPILDTSYSDMILGSVPCDGVIQRTWTATDDCGNQSSCVQNIVIMDNIPPTISCPSDLTVSTNPGQCYYTGTLPQPTATDNCNQNPTVTCYLVTPGGLVAITPQTQFPKGMNTICCIADDGCVDVSELICTYPCVSGSGDLQPSDSPLNLGQNAPPSSQPEELLTTIGIQPGISGDVLVKDVFVGGNCFDISNVTTFGQASQLGTFSNGLTNIGFDSGVILATGPGTLAIGPNNDDNAGSAVGGPTPDADLSTLTTGTLHDKATLEFDFIPATSVVTFSYVFASEEYCELTGNPINDVFGFFISGPGIPGGTQNIALIPTTSTPVGINTVNHSTFSGFYVNNQPATSANLCGQSPAVPPVTNELQYDGYTRKFTAIANVQPGQTYHLKLAIADVGDGLHDSAIFLDAGSFDAGGDASVEWQVNSNPVSSTVYENCGTVNLVFDRVGGNSAVALPVSYTITGSATPGLDYTPITSSITIPAGQNQLILPITILNDAILEGDETIIITLTNACSFLMPQKTLTIKDMSLLQAKCTYTLTVEDHEQPMISCPPNVTIAGIADGQGSCTLQAGVFVPLAPTVSDNCPMLMVDYAVSGATTATGVNSASGVTFSGGTSTITYTATDMGGNMASCQTEVTVVCDFGSTCECPPGSFQGPDLIVNGDFSAGNTGFTSDYNFSGGLPSSPNTYAISNSNFLQNSNFWNCLDHTSGTLTGQFLAADASLTPGKAVWRQNVAITPSTEYQFCAYVNNIWWFYSDASDPDLQVWLVDGNNNATLLTSAILPEVPDFWVKLNAAWSAPAVLVNPYRLEIRDASTVQFGNDFAIDDISFRSCSQPQPCNASFTVTPIDNCGHVQANSTSTGLQPISYQWFTSESTPNIDLTLPCGPTTFSVSITCADGSMSSATQTINITDNTPPTIVCPQDIQTDCFSPTTPATTGFATATDDCTILSLTFTDVVTGTQPCDQVTTRTWKAEDWCNNVSTCVQTITVMDDVAPVLTNCPPNVIVTGIIDPNGDCTANVQVISPTVTDNCDQSVSLVNSFNNTADASGVYPNGTTTVTWTATDDCGNTATCDFMVTVDCNEAICCPQFSLLELDSIMPCPGDLTCRGDSTANLLVIPGAAKRIACKNGVRYYYIVPNLPGFTYTWTVTGGTPASFTGNPGVITWGNGSTGSFQVIITDATGTCRDTISQEFCLLDSPTAGFTVNPGPATTVCVNQPVNFTNTSFGTNGYYWDFGDGTGSSSPNPPPHSYPAVGTYTVLLTVSNGANVDIKCGCVDTATAIINVIAGTGPSISSLNCKEMLCRGDTATYCVSSGCAPFNWTVNGGTIMVNNGACITVKWDATSPPTLPAFVSVTTGCGGLCGSSATLNVPVLWNNMPVSGPKIVCVGATETYSLPTMPGTFYNWSVTGGGGFPVGPSTNTPSFTVHWNGPVGQGTVTCSYNNPFSDCNGATTLTVDVKPKFTIAGPATACQGDQSVYSVTSGGSATWTISPGTPGTDYTVSPPTGAASIISVTWITPGSYTITALPTNGTLFCNPSAAINVVVKPAPVVTLTGALVVCPNQLINYSATSSLPSDGSFTWTLTGTGGTVSPYGPNNSNASVNFTGTGPWMLMATQSVNGCPPGTATLTITKEPAPTLPPAPITGCIGAKINVSVLSGNSPFTWSTSAAATLIGGQGTSSAMYEIHGTGTIFVSNCGGPSNSINVSTSAPPAISITKTGSLCTGDLQLTANNTSGTVSSYQWLGGSSATTQTIQVTTPGTYTVQITFTDGCKSVATYTVPPEVVPSVAISTGDPLGWCPSSPITVNLQAYTLSSGCSYQWYDANGPIPGAVSPTGTYTAHVAGSYYVVVTCNGCVATSNIITVSVTSCTGTGGPACTGVPNPLGTIMENQGNPITMCNPKTFEVPVSNCSDPVYWDFGDGTPIVTGNYTSATTNAATHTYAHPGAYLVTASINCNGCSFIVYKNVNVPVVADFVYSVQCGLNGSNSITLYNASETLGGWNVTSVNWTTTCGTPTTGTTGDIFSLNTIFGCDPTVTMTITVTDPISGQICSDSKTFHFNFATTPLAITGLGTVCKDQFYTFNYTLSGPNIVQYAWSVNNTAVSQQAALNYAFGVPGSATIDLTVTDAFGCTYTASTTVTVEMPDTLSINPVKICPDCMPPATLTTTPASGFTNYQWYFNGSAIPGATGATYQLCQPNTIGNYYVTAEDPQHNNCLVTSDTAQVTYHPTPNVDIQGETIQCVSGNGPYSFYLNNAAGNDPNLSYSWTASPAATFTPNNSQYDANISVSALGTYQFILTVTDMTTGCMARDTFCMYLYLNPTVTIVGPPGTLCEGKPYTFTASVTPSGNYVYLWSNGATGQVMTTSQAGSYSVIATDPESGCSGTSTNTFNILSKPSAILFPVGCDTICDTGSITPPFIPNGSYTIQWFLNGVSTPFFSGPTFNLGGNVPPPLVYGNNDIYIVVTDFYGCSDTSNLYNLYIKQCCICKSELAFSSGGVEYPVTCDPHIGFIPSLPCPVQDVIVSGYFGFVDETTGEPCEETPVIWEFVKPDGSTQGGSAPNFTSFLFLKDSISAPGLYCLNLSTVSPDGLDTCVCKITWIQESCNCCTTLQDFCDRLENNVYVSVDENQCKATLNIGNFNGCDDYIEWVDWNFPSQQQTGPFPPGSMPMHTYPGSGTYVVCYQAIERDSTGINCFEKLVCDTITVECPGCYCGTFTAMNFIPFTRNVQITPASCDGTSVLSFCPPPGSDIQLSGLFQCAGPNCPPSAQITWDLYLLPNTTTPVASSSTTANPQFGINILPLWYATPGTYELHITGHCGLQECPCIVKFTVNCPDPCPCDVTQLAKDVAKGFAVASSGVSCKACFAPIALNDCDMVTWHIGSTSNPPIGMSIGKQTFCHTFPGGGTYTVFMVVTRKKSDGTICEMGVKSQTVTVLCIPVSICTESVLDNPSFSINAVGGSLGQMGMGASANWTAAAGEPIVLEGFTGLDAWSISLSGNYDAADALMPSEPVCLDNTEGMITIRSKDMTSGGRPRPCDRIVVALDNDWLLDNNYILAQFALSELDWGEWYDIQIPYNLADWPGLESCGNDLQGARVQPIVYTTNVLIDAQGGIDTRSTIQVDYFCMDGQLITGTKNFEKPPALRLYPNPTTGALTLEWVNTDVKNGVIQLTGPLGQTLRNWTIPHGTDRMEVQLNDLPGGMYFVKLISDGRLVAVRKVVRQ